MEIYFKEGDKVSHQGFGNGVVVSLNGENNYYPVIVEFEGYGKKEFSIQGGQSYNQPYPSLLQGHDRFIAQPNKPIFEPKQGDLVWAKHAGDWSVVYYQKEGFCGVNKNESLNHLLFQSTEIRPFKGEIPND